MKTLAMVFAFVVPAALPSQSLGASFDERYRACKKMAYMLYEDDLQERALICKANGKTGDAALPCLKPVLDNIRDAIEKCMDKTR